MENKQGRFPVRKNVRLDVVFRFLVNFALCDGMFVLFLTKKGLPLWQIGLLEGVFHLTGIVSEIPSGALADLWGRKWVLLASRLCGAVSSLIMISTDSFWLLAVGFVFTSWSYNLVSGSEDALVYDSLLQGGQENRFFRLNSRLSFLAEISGGLALLAGGYLAEISYVLCYVIVIGIDVVAGLLCAFMTEPKNTEKRLTVKEHFIASGKLIKSDKRLWFLLVHYGVLFGFQTAVFLYSQTFYHSRGLTESRIGLMLLGVSLCNSIGALLSEKLVKTSGGKASLLCGGISGLGIMLMTAKRLPLSLLGCTLSNMANASLYPIQSNELNRLIPSAQRATLISVSSMCFSAVMIALFPLMGAIMEWTGMDAVFFGTGAVLLLYVLLFGRKYKG